MRQIKGGSAGIEARARARGRAPEAALGQSTVGSPPLCQTANTAGVLSPARSRDDLELRIVAVLIAVARLCSAPRGGVMEGVCLCLDLDEERGIFSRPEAGARRPHAFRRQYPERGHKTLVSAAPPRNPEFLARAPSRRASSLMALCTHPLLRRERYRCDPAITVRLEANRGRYWRQRVATIGVDDGLASAIACPDRHCRHSRAGAGRHQTRR